MTVFNRTWMIPGRNFKWSSESYTHNFFRAIEMVFGRKNGVRPSVSSFPDGHGGTIEYAHNLEAAIAIIEGRVRRFNLASSFGLEPVRIYLPVLAPIGVPGMPAPSFPWLMAIAYDAPGSAGSSTNVTSLTWTHTCTGSNLVLQTSGTFSSRSTLSSSYNGSASTQASTLNWAGSFNTGKQYYLANPSTGSHTNSFSTSGSAANAVGGSISVTGADTVTVIGQTGTNGTFGTTATTTSVSLAGVLSGSLIIDQVVLNDSVAAESAAVTGTGQTKRYSTDNTNGGWSIHGSTMTTSGAGTYVPAWSFTSTAFGQMAIEIRAAGTYPTPTGPVRQATNLATAGTTETISLDFTGTTGNNLMLIVCFPSGQTNLGTNPYTATYNGVSLTSAGSYNGAVIEPGQIMYLAAPDVSAAHNLVVTKGSGNVVSYIAFIIQDAAQTSPIDQALSHNSSASGTSATTNTRTSASTSLNIAQININQPSSGHSVTTGTQIGTTYQQTSYESVYGMVGILPATGGADSITFGWTTSQGWDAAIVSFKYLASTSTNSNFLSFM